MVIADQVVKEIIDLYNNYGNQDYIGEPVSQIEHMCQCAMLALEAGYDDEIILAALFHDIGHLLEHHMEAGTMAGWGVVDHESIGAGYLLQKGFSARIAKLVESHVPAKRYLTCRNPSYYNNLSEASRHTLKFQGGVMSEAEAVAFEADPEYLLYVQLRSWDESAKKTGVPLPDMALFSQKMLTHLQGRNS